MAHYAKIVNDIVEHVIVIDDEQVQNLEGEWIKTSYNTFKGIHLTDGEPSEDQSKALRKNFAAIGHIYDRELDAFYCPKPFDSWILDTETCTWNAPIDMPEDGNSYLWNEEEQTWVVNVFRNE